MKLSSIIISAAAAQGSYRGERSLTYDLRRLEFMVRTTITGIDIANGVVEASSHEQSQLDKQNGLVVKKLLNYGCWGQIYSDHGTTPGYGEPLDKFDELAKSWQQCRACATIDYGCPKKVKNWADMYDVDGGFQTYPIVWLCGMNTDDCKLSFCQCDIHYAQELATLYQNGEYQMNNAYVTNADGSGFDHAYECGAPSPASSSNNSSNANNNGGNGNGSTKQCCGAYPNRASFDSKHHDCCANSFLADIGGCLV